MRRLAKIVRDNKSNESTCRNTINIFSTNNTNSPRIKPGRPIRSVHELEFASSAAADHARKTAEKTKYSFLDRIGE